MRWRISRQLGHRAGRFGSAANAPSREEHEACRDIRLAWQSCQPRAMHLFSDKGSVSVAAACHGWAVASDRRLARCKGAYAGGSARSGRATPPFPELHAANDRSPRKIPAEGGHIEKSPPSFLRGRLRIVDAGSISRRSSGSRPNSCRCDLGRVHTARAGLR